jgi:branched-chain amino acid transport system permease protein
MTLAGLLASQCLNALAVSALLFFISVGLTLIFGIMRIVNFAHGAIYMLGAYVGASVAQLTGSYWIALVAAPLIVGMLGLIAEPFALRPLYRHEGGVFLLVTFGMALVLGEIIRLGWGPEPRRLDLPVLLSGTVRVMGETFPVYRLFLAASGVAAAAALWLVLARTRIGVLIRATAQNPEMVHALGVDIHRVRSATFALGCALAALGGVMATPLLTADLGMGTNVIIDAFVIVIIGGLGSLLGSALGSLLVGTIQTFGNFLVPDIALGISYLVMIAVLVVRPQGLFGEAE